jgi:hypothetical protein
MHKGSSLRLDMGLPITSSPYTRQLIGVLSPKKD